MRCQLPFSCLALILALETSCAGVRVLVPRENPEDATGTIRSTRINTSTETDYTQIGNEVSQSQSMTETSRMANQALEAPAAVLTR
jgi:hypothetical protein